MGKFRKGPGNALCLHSEPGMSVLCVCARLCVRASNLFCLAGYIDIVCYSAGSSVCLSTCQASSSVPEWSQAKKRAKSLTLLPPFAAFYPLIDFVDHFGDGKVIVRHFKIRYIALTFYNSSQTASLLFFGSFIRYTVHNPVCLQWIMFCPNTAM